MTSERLVLTSVQLDQVMGCLMVEDLVIDEEALRQELLKWYGLSGLVFEPQLVVIRPETLAACARAVAEDGIMMREPERL